MDVHASMPRLDRRGGRRGRPALVKARRRASPSTRARPREHGGLLNDLVTGVQYDIVNQAKAERHLQNVQEKLRRDAERGDSAAVDRDARRIDSLKYRIVVDEWLIRQNSLQDPGCYPYPLRPDPMSCAAVAEAARPAGFPISPQPRPGRAPESAPMTIAITVAQCRAVGPRPRLLHRRRRPSGRRRIAPGLHGNPELEDLL